MNDPAHPLFGGALGDAARRGAGVGLAPLSEGYSAQVPNPWQGVGTAPLSEGQTAFVPNPAWPGMTALWTGGWSAGNPGRPLEQASPPAPMQFDRLPKGRGNPGSHVNWMHNNYGTEKIRYRLPNGQTGQATPHRIHVTPSGNLTSKDHVLTARTTYIRRWAPAAWGPTRPAGARGAWVQLSRGEVNVGLLHVPGLPTRPVVVLQIENDMNGRPRALVRHRKAEANPRTYITPAGALTSNPGRTVSTRGAGARIPRQTARIVLPGEAGDAACRLFPWMKRCQPKTTPIPNPGGAIGPVKSRVRMAARGVKAAVNPPPSGNGLQRAAQLWGDLMTGRASLVLDRGGITVRRRAA